MKQLFLVGMSVVIATRERPALVARAVASVLDSRGAELEVLVVDQRDHPQPIPGATCLISRPGLSRARNLGWRASRHALVAFTDDDCLVHPDWARQLQIGFQEQPRAGIVFGNVRAAEERAVSCLRTTPALARTFGEKHRVEGVAGCMAVRRQLLEELDGFDELLGLGAPLRSGEEVDLSLRALRAGWWLYHTPAAEVLHSGAVEPQALGTYVRARLFGVGACYAKQLRQGNWSVLPHLARLALRRHSAVQFGPGARRLDRLAGFSLGLLAGWRRPLDERGMFR